MRQCVKQSCKDKIKKQTTTFIATLTSAVFCLNFLAAPCAFSDDSRKQETDMVLFSPVKEISSPLDRQPPGVLRSRVVQTDIEQIDEIHDMRINTFVLNLFDNEQHYAKLETIEYGTHGRFHLIGVLEDTVDGTFIIAVGDDGIAGTVKNGSYGTYRISHHSEGLSVIQHLDDQNAVSCSGGIRVDTKLPKRGPEQEFEASKKDISGTLEVLTAYTPAARDEAGGHSEMLTLINLAVAETNRGWNISQINPDLKLVGVAELRYTESGDIGTDLSRLRKKNDGYMDIIHDIRDAVGADFVNLIVDSTEAGIAYVPGSLSSAFESSAFSVVDIDYATGYYTYGHELGHNQGCAHDHDNSMPNDGLYPYSHGHRWIEPLPSSVTLRTVMAYPPGVRVNHYSNPDVIYNMFATGVPMHEPGAANNALTINNSASTVANFRHSQGTVVWIDFSNVINGESGTYAQPYNSIAEGINAVPFGGILRIKTGAKVENVRISKELTIRPFNGPVRIIGAS